MTRHRLGIVTNEFFHRTEGGIGGFGWATRAVCALLRQRPELGLEPVVLTPRRRAVENVAGAHVVHQSGNRLQLARAVRQARIDLLLAIDYRPNYLPLLAALPRTPLVVWARDPRTPDDASASPPCGSPVVRTRCHTASTPSTAPRCAASSPPLASWDDPCSSGRPRRPPRRPGAAGVRSRPHRAGVAAEPDRHETERRQERPPAARLPCPSRPLQTALAPGRGGPAPARGPVPSGRRPGGGPAAIGDLGTLPANVELVGHVDGEEKQRLLTSAWALVNTSVHEGLPVSFLEALACETPIVAALDPEGVVSRFGTVVDQSEGSGEPLSPCSWERSVACSPTASGGKRSDEPGATGSARCTPPWRS